MRCVARDLRLRRRRRRTYLRLPGDGPVPNKQGPLLIIVRAPTESWDVCARACVCVCCVLRAPLCSQAMRRYLQVGQRECWRKLPMLQSRLRIAHALRALQAALHDTAGAGAAGGHETCGAPAAGGAFFSTLKRSDSHLSF